MDIAIGIPNSVRGTTGAQLLEWARRAEQAGFSSLASIGALSYPSFEELTVFAAAGAVTERIRFLSNVLIGPARSTALLAKQAASVHHLTGGRLTLGLGVGWRETDYLLTGRDYHTRGAAFDTQLADLRRAWDGELLRDGTRPVVPEPWPNGGIPLLIGGMTQATLRRIVDHGVGWTAGGAPPDMTAAFIQQVRSAWQDASRAGTPHIVALQYFSLGDTEQESRRSLLDYYAPMGDMAHMVADSAHRSPDAIQQTVTAFADIGVDELVLDPTVPDPNQVNFLADVVLTR